MSHLQSHPDYGLQSLHDEQVELYLSQLQIRYNNEPSFVQVVLEIADHFNESPNPNSILNIELDFDITPPDPNAFFHDIIALARVAPNAAAACLDTSSIFMAEYKAATGGVKETQRPFRAAYFIDRFISRVQEMRDREESPFAVLQALRDGPDKVHFADYVSRYEIFCGPQENDGRIQSPSFPDEVVSRGVLLSLILAEGGKQRTERQQNEVNQWINKLSAELSEGKFKGLAAQYRDIVSTMDATERVRAMMCTMAGRMFIVERPEQAIAAYYWDPDTLKAVRVALKKYAEDVNGPKLYGSYWRSILAWSLVFSGLLLAVLSGVLNWANRENGFERVNDVFQTFLLVLSVPAFTVKIAATNGDQAIKDWLVGVRRIETMEELEHQIHKRLSCNKRRGWLAIQRVKCETDDRQNWTAPDNMCFKTGHLDGSLRARKDRNMSELELVTGTNGKRARSWVEISNETNILGGDVNHLQFTCGTTIVERTTSFFSHTPSKRVWFA